MPACWPDSGATQKEVFLIIFGRLWRAISFLLFRCRHYYYYYYYYGQWHSYYR